MSQYGQDDWQRQYAAPRRDQQEQASYYPPTQGIPPPPPAKETKYSPLLLILFGICLLVPCGFVAIILSAIAIPNFQEAQIRQKTSDTVSAMRGMATVLESYYVDNNRYPPYHKVGNDPRESYLYNSSRLTTPVGYIEELPTDLFADNLKQEFHYYCTRSGWIVWSCGPDGEFEITPDDYDANLTQPSLHLITARTYNPTNGTVSRGDIWRVRQ